MKKAQDQLALVEVEGQSGAGFVRVVMTCKNDVKRVTDKLKKTYKNRFYNIRLNINKIK